jgi:hypothetical protein
VSRKSQPGLGLAVKFKFKFVVGAPRRLDWTGSRCEADMAVWGLGTHTCASVVGVSVDPSVAGRG